MLIVSVVDLHGLLVAIHRLLGHHRIQGHLLLGHHRHATRSHNLLAMTWDHPSCLGVAHHHRLLLLHHRSWLGQDIEVVGIVDCIEERVELSCGYLSLLKEVLACE